MKKILWCSDSPIIPTGYAQVTRNVGSRLKQAGFDFNVLGFQQWSMPITEIKYQEGWLNFPLYPVLSAGEFYGNQGSIEYWVNNLKPNVTIFLLDSFMLRHLVENKLRGNVIERTMDKIKNVTSPWMYFPFDSADVYAGAKEVLESMDVRIAMSKFAQKLLKEQTGLDSFMIPHGVDTLTYRPLPKDYIDKFKTQMGIQNKFVIGSVFRNQTRKLPSKLLKAFKIFSENKTDVVLLMHCLPGETPIIIRRDGLIDVIPIREITDWTRNGGMETKELMGVEIWDGKAFVKCRYAKRQVKREKIQRTITYGSLIDSTEEHALLTDKELKLCAKDLKIGDSILFGGLPCCPSKLIMDDELAWLFGFFVAEGTCNKYKHGSQFYSQWKIDNCNRKYLERASSILINFFDCKTVIREFSDPRYKNRKIFRLTADKTPMLTDFFGACYTVSNHGKKLKREKKVPNLLFRSDYESIKNFIDGYVCGDGHIINDNSFSIKTNSQVLAQGILLLVQQIYPDKNINIFSEERKIKENQYHKSYYDVTFTKNKIINERNVIKKIFTHPSKELFVYDLTTESGRFATGVGMGIVHNCDQNDPQGQNLNDLIDKLKINRDKIRFTNMNFISGVTAHDVNLIYNMMDCHALSTTGEGFGLPIIESQSAGIPNICTNYTAPVELIEGHGQLVKIKDFIEGQMNTNRAMIDTEDMANCFEKYYNNRELMRKHGVEARKFTLEHYNWEKVMRMWIELLTFGEIYEQP